MSVKHLARDICLFKGGNAHMQPELLAKQWPGVAKVGGFLHLLLPVDHNPSSLRFLAVTLTANDLYFFSNSEVTGTAKTPCLLRPVKVVTENNETPGFFFN